MWDGPVGAAGLRLHLRRDGAAERIVQGSNRLVATDIEATNGVIHVIDRVILPEM